MFYEEVLRLLNKKKVRYVVIGGIALNLHGVPRTTSDLDLAIAIDKGNLGKIVQTMQELGFRPRAPVDAGEFADPENLKLWLEEQNMKVFTFWNPGRPYEEVDILIFNPIPFEEMERNREKVKARNIEIPLISLEFLIKLKKYSDREQDRSDIEALRKIKEIQNEK